MAMGIHWLPAPASHGHLPVANPAVVTIGYGHGHKVAQKRIYTWFHEINLQVSSGCELKCESVEGPILRRHFAQLTCRLPP